MATARQPGGLRISGTQVPITRRLPAARPLRTAAGAFGIGMALMLMLLLNGLWSGVQERVTTYEDHLEADLVVVPGTDNLFADPGGLPADTVATVARTPGVDRAVPLRTMYSIVELPHDKAAVAAVASDPAGPGGPWSFAAGREPDTSEEVAVDRLFVEQHGLAMGDRLPIHDAAGLRHGGGDDPDAACRRHHRVGAGHHQ